MKIKSYCEDITGSSYPWRQVLTSLHSAAFPEDIQITDLIKKAASWITDPVSNLELNIPRYTETLNDGDGEMIVDQEGGGVPKDEGLVDMACMFLDYLEKRSFEDCLDLLYKIEKYAHEKYG